MKKELACIVCPMSCHLVVEFDGEQVASVSGNTCLRGDAYARKELVMPMRTVTTTVRIHHATYPLLPVITAMEVPKEKIFDIMEAVKQIEVQAPITCGEVVAVNVAGTGVDLLASKTMEEHHETMCIASAKGLEAV